MTERCAQSGVTLIEMLVALSVFALIGLASFAVLDTIVRTDRQSSGRLESLAKIDTVLRIFEADALLARTRPMVTPKAVSFVARDHQVTYAQTSRGVLRRIERPGVDPLEQQLLPPPSTANWRFVTVDAAGVIDPQAAVEFVVQPDGDSAEAVRKLVPVPPALTKRP